MAKQDRRKTAAEIRLMDKQAAREQKETSMYTLRHVVLPVILASITGTLLLVAGIIAAALKFLPTVQAAAVAAVGI